ncbi:MAG: diguanylate cyclase [Spirulinaceae cyanobacterium SM2_1_0]|nr:diguanylate cyclase [Spirulinaceae cyanobacterium SM2_1_0]
MSNLPAPKADILVVDDQPDNIRLLSTMLSEQGYKVRKALNGEMALVAVGKAAIDLILLDIMMPDMDGYEVCTQLKARADTTNIPVIFLSALDEAIDKVKAFQVGGVDYISKPFQLEEVLVRIQNQLTIQQQQQQLNVQNELLQKEVREHQQTTEVLYQSRALLASVLNSSLDGVAALQAIRNPAGKITDFRCLTVNPVAAQILGHNHDELMGNLGFQELTQNIDHNLFQTLVRVVETGKTVEQELYCEQAEPPTWFYFVAVKLGDGFAVTFRDITENKRIMTALKEANTELARLSQSDSLTGVANRRHFDEYFTWVWQELSQKPDWLAFLICDIDCFKLYNDTYGHQLGDECLRQIAQTVEQTVIADCPQGLVARYGGEEFVAVLPATNLAQSQQIAEHILSEIKRQLIPHSSSTVGQYVTASIGLTATRPTAELSRHSLISIADLALYEAKEQGRDRVVTLEA